MVKEEEKQTKPLKMRCKNEAVFKRLYGRDAPPCGGTYVYASESYIVSTVHVSLCIGAAYSALCVLLIQFLRFIRRAVAAAAVSGGHQRARSHTALYKRDVENIKAIIESYHSIGQYCF